MRAGGTDAVSRPATSRTILIVYHVAITAAADYATRRESHRHRHLERIEGLRAAGICIGGGPSPDGTRAELFYRLQQPGQIVNVVEEDPYWAGGVWTAYVPRSFTEFVEPWEVPPVVVDGSRRVTVVEGPTTDVAMGQFALIEMRGAGRIAFGGFLPDGRVIALARAAEPDTAAGWFADAGFWDAKTLEARPLLHVL